MYEKTLVLPRSIWEIRTLRESGYDFTKEELDEAEKHELRFIKEVKTKLGYSVKCYLAPMFQASTQEQRMPVYGC